MSKFLSVKFTFLFLCLIFVTCNAKKKKVFECKNPPSCGKIHNITYPFGIKGDPRSCGDPDYLLSCENNQTILYFHSGRYLVQAINHNNYTIRIADASLRSKDCSSVPLRSLTLKDFNFPDPYSPVSYQIQRLVILSCGNLVTNYSSLIPIPAHCVSRKFSCKFGSNCSSAVALKRYAYVVYGDVKAAEIPDACKVELVFISTNTKRRNNLSYLDIHDGLLYGFELSWTPIRCSECRGWVTSSLCLFETQPYMVFLGCNRDWRVVIGITFTIWGFIVFVLGPCALKCICGTPCVAIFFMYKWRRRHLSAYDKIEGFLRSHNLMPVMYSYSEIRKMSKGFKEKLGEGGYASVYKGKLRSGRTVAIKMLNKPKSNGQEFINEVGSIGRIHHANITTLIGFCAERSKHALVYEYMPNGSLEKYIFSEQEAFSLNCEQMYQISLGVARGINYLHRGCYMQILHFDIKPHNILLDENFNPKVSDFGLAKLYPTGDSIVSLTAPRGTMGYMAPELFYKNIGGVSYKADVYSFGMLLMEMAGRRKNLNALVEQSSQIYFPTWVYNQFHEGNDIEFGDVTNEGRKTTTKMLMVALWCIQMNPNNRPSMEKVLEMLEGELESMEFPPKPFLSHQELNQEEA